jgi:hypothetical protein
MAETDAPWRHVHPRPSLVGKPGGENTMVKMGLRFDLRNPSFAGVSSSERLQAAVDMAEWADERG